MPTRRKVLGAACPSIVWPVAGCLGGADDAPRTTAAPTDTTAMAPELTFDTPAFEAGEAIPERYTCDGADVSPELTIDGVPDATRALAVVVDDPDAPGGTFTHWLLWNVPAETATIASDVPADETVADLGDARQGTNGFGSVGYRGPCPPQGDGPHTYRFTLHALDARLELEAGADRGEIEDALADSSIATTRFTGRYER